MKLTDAQRDALKTLYEDRRANRVTFPSNIKQGVAMSLRKKGLARELTVANQNYLTPEGYALADEMFGMDWWRDLMRAFIAWQEHIENDRRVADMLGGVWKEAEFGESYFSLDVRPGYKPDWYPDISTHLEAESERGGVVVRCDYTIAGSGKYRVDIIRSWKTADEDEAEQFGRDVIEAARICRLLNAWMAKREAVR